MSSSKDTNKALPIFILLFVASLGVSVYLFFRYAKNAAVLEAQHEELQMAYEVLDLQADSIQIELDEALRQLQLKINENLAQVDLKEDLRMQLEEKSRALAAAHARISRLIAQGNETGGSKKLLEAKEEINTLTEKNEEYLEEIERTQRKYAQAKERAELSEKRASELLGTTDSLNVVNDLLSKKLATASILDIAGLKVSGVRTKKGNEEPTPKANKTERLKIQFDVLGSEISEIEEKEITIRLIGPNGAVLTRDTKTLTNSDELHSLQKSIDYDGTEKKIIFYYDQEESYKKGSYSIELYNEDILLDRSSFSLR